MHRKQSRRGGRQQGAKGSFLAVAGLIVTLAAIAGFIRLKPRIEAPIVVDFSGSYCDTFPSHQRLLYLSQEVLRVNTPTTVTAFGDQVREVARFHSGDPQGLVRLDIWFKENRQGVCQGGTQAEKAFTYLVDFAKRSRADAIYIRILTDGGWFDDNEALKRAIEKLAANPKVKVIWVHGISHSESEPVRSLLEPAFGPNRLILSYGPDAEDALKQWERVVRQNSIPFLSAFSLGGRQ